MNRAGKSIANNKCIKQLTGHDATLTLKILHFTALNMTERQPDINHFVITWQFLIAI